LLIALILIIAWQAAWSSTRTLILASVQTRSDRPFDEGLPVLLAERGLSQRKLAQLIDLNPSHLSRVLRSADRTRPSTELIRRIARALDLPPGYFPELREAAVIERLKLDARLRDELYDQLEAGDLH
jgi:transcriptional regulator with XRE-family HTH domain